jgi:hypothetical protein
MARALGWMWRKNLDGCEEGDERRRRRSCRQLVHAPEAVLVTRKLGNLMNSWRGEGSYREVRHGCSASGSCL